MKNTKLTLLAAIFGFALAFTFSCSSDDDKGGGSSSPSSGGGLVNADNEAWLRMNKYTNGYIFKPNGEFIWIIKSKKNDGKWCLQDRSAYSISGNQLCIGSWCKTYSINGDTFTLWLSDDSSDSYLRTSGVYTISGDCEDERD